MHAKRRAWELCGGYCHYCLVPLKYKKATLDHVVPRVAGGTKIIGGDLNVVIACEWCNKAKSDMPLAKFLASPGFKERLRRVADGNHDMQDWVTAFRKFGQPRSEVRELISA